MLLLLAIASFTFSQNPTTVALPGDLVSVSVANESSLSGRYRVDTAGSISLPLLGKLTVITKDAKSIDDLIESRIKESLSKLEDVEIRFEADKQTPARIYGASRLPADVRLTSPLSLVKVAAMAEPFPNWNLAGAKAYSIAGEARTDGLVRPGDRVYIPVKMQADEVTVVGGVKQPGVVKMSDQMTLKEAIASAGGLAPRGDRSRIFLIRSSEQGPYDLDRNGDMVLRNKDQLRVELKPESAFVTVTGGVPQSLNAEWDASLTLKDLIMRAGGVLAENPTITIRSITNPKKKAWKCRWKDLFKEKFKPAKLEAGDVIEVSAK